MNRNEVALRLAIEHRGYEASVDAVLETAERFLTFLRFGQRPAPAVETVTPRTPIVPGNAYVDYR